MNYQDEMVRAIKTRFAKDISESISLSREIKLSRIPSSVTIPLAAEVDLLYKKGLAGFMSKGSVRDINSDKFYVAQSFFGLPELLGAQDQFGMIDSLFDDLKEKLKKSLINSELDRFLPPKEIEFEGQER